MIMIKDDISFKPIGWVRCQAHKKYQASRQAALNEEPAYIELAERLNWPQLLEGLEGFERLWVIYYMNQVKSVKSKVLVPRLGKKVGVLATRSPHRPNPIGLSCVKLIEIKSRKIFIHSHDMLDQTPVLDIKPYLPYADAFTEAKYGWVQELDAPWIVHWPKKIIESIFWLKSQGELLLSTSALDQILQSGPYPNHYNRIKVEGDLGVIAMGNWRVHFKFRDRQIWILELASVHENNLLNPSDLATSNLHSSWIEYNSKSV
jgi:tRNA-Thr(GGU) m(6)t(6)A37 methyltransferase TsaA